MINFNINGIKCLVDDRGGKTKTKTKTKLKGISLCGR